MLAVFDIDGVVADVRHRLHLIERRRSWRAFFEAAADDTLLAEGARLVADLGRNHEIVWLSGRPEWLRDLTTSWLATQRLPCAEVYLRPDGDSRPASSFKIDILRRLHARGVAAVIDDDDEVVTAATKVGFPAVLADWVPRNGTLRRAQDRRGRT